MSVCHIRTWLPWIGGGSKQPLSMCLPTRIRFGWSVGHTSQILLQLQSPLAPLLFVSFGVALFASWNVGMCNVKDPHANCYKFSTNAACTSARFFLLLIIQWCSLCGVDGACRFEARVKLVDDAGRQINAVQVFGIIQHPKSIVVFDEIKI